MKYASIHEIFQSAVMKLQADPERFNGINAVYHIALSYISWVLNFRGKPYSLLETTEIPNFPFDCVVKASDDTFLKLCNGDLNIPWAIFTGKLKITDLGLAKKLADVLK